MRTNAFEMFVTCVLALGCVLGSPTLLAQTPPTPQSKPTSAATETYDEFFMSAEHRRQIYEESRKKPGKAVLFTALFPGLGNLYAEQFLLTGLAIVAMVFAGTFVGYGLSTKQPNIVILGGVTAGIAYSGGMLTSAYGVGQYNRKLRQGLKIEDAEVPPQVRGPALALRF